MTSMDIRSITMPIILQHDIARPHISHDITDVTRKWKFEPIPHPPNLPDLAPCDFHFFPHLKSDYKGNPYTTNNEVQEAAWIQEGSPDLFSDGMQKLVRLDKVYPYKRG